MTLLEGLCKVSGRQGGTIHQFFPNGVDENVRFMMRVYNELTAIGIEFPSRASFDKLATYSHTTIDWGR